MAVLWRLLHEWIQGSNDNNKRNDVIYIGENCLTMTVSMEF